jgi:formamidopyrimidine-DNA glycosylase
MPELPEVTALVADLGPRLVGRSVDRVEIISFSALKTFEISPSELHGQTVTSVSRHGKFLDFVIGDIHLITHLALLGWLRWREKAPVPSARPTRGPLAARFVLEGGEGFDLTEMGTKKGLGIWLVRHPNDVPGVARLGPDPLDPSFTVDALARILSGQGRAQIKGVLRQQSIIAGIGNAYSDEILHTAKMTPFRPANMDAADVQKLYDAIQSTLRDAIKRADGLTASELKAEKKSGLQVHGRTGQACPVCGDTIRQVTYTDSNFQYCPTCQTGGKPLADRVLSRLLK